MSVRNKSRIISVFVFYLFFAIVLPAYHCHESNGMHLQPFFKDGCCELHGEDPGSGHNHHVHFLIEDQAAFAKSRQNNNSTTPLKWLALPEIAHFIQAPLSRGFLPFSIKKAFHQEYFTSFSGLSPPQV